jgi:hypothetical protein
MRFSVHDDGSGAALASFATYGEATADARERSTRAKPDAVFHVYDLELKLTLNQFRYGETLLERIHKNAVMAVWVARSADHLQRVVTEYAEDLGLPELGEVAYDEAVPRAADLPALAEVFQAAAEKSDQFDAPPASSRNSR